MYGCTGYINPHLIHSKKQTRMEVLTSNIATRLFTHLRFGSSLLLIFFSAFSHLVFAASVLFQLYLKTNIDKLINYYYLCLINLNLFMSLFLSKHLCLHDTKNCKCQRQKIKKYYTITHHTDIATSIRIKAFQDMRNLLHYVSSMK